MTTLTSTYTNATPLPYRRRIDHLNEASVSKFYMPYSDIQWDAPENTINHDDNIWSRRDATFLTQTSWYAQLPEQTQKRLGLQLVVNSMKMGIFFENILTRGLLNFARSLPDGAAEFRYVMHEAIEESHHSLMFQEFVNRAGLPPAPPNWLARWGGFYAVQMSKIFPEQFFIFVLGGELPIDHMQRLALETPEALHPLVRKIMQIHTTEEARHISFAKLYLQNQVPKLSIAKRTRLAISTPITLRVMAGMMLRPSTQMIAAFEIPKAVINDAYDDNSDYHARVRASFSDITELCGKLGLLDSAAKPLWKGFL